MDELVDLEQRGWEALRGNRGAAFYDELMADDAVMVFPMGVLDRQESLQAIRDASPWVTYRLESEAVVRPSPDVGIVVYHAVARRQGADEYRAWMTSTYVREPSGRWRLALHQQSPG
jgi:ketosteroid isomerase-like protein